VFWRWVNSVSFYSLFGYFACGFKTTHVCTYSLGRLNGRRRSRIFRHGAMTSQVVMVTVTRLLIHRLQSVVPYKLKQQQQQQDNRGRQISPRCATHDEHLRIYGRRLEPEPVRWLWCRCGVTSHLDEGWHLWATINS